MLRDWALLEGADEKLSKLSDCPCNWRRSCEPFVYAGVVKGAMVNVVEVPGSGIIETLESIGTQCIVQNASKYNKARRN